jgi:DNA-binding MarR family transcriptional regulator/N-acetylglutamate synthase-like GNAT family acetyltransferase
MAESAGAVAQATTGGHESTIARVRAFNRFYTRVIGVLDERHVGSPYSLTEARVLYEMARGGLADAAGACEVVELRRRLNLDAGYLSRVLTRFEDAGMVGRTRSSVDGRRQAVTLTETGRATFAELEQQASDAIEALVGELGEDARRRLVGAMAAIREILEPTTERRTVVLRPPEPGDLGWVIERNAAIYAHEYGWDASYETLVARIVTDYAERHDARREAAWIAEVGGDRVGCVFCVAADATTAKLRLLLVEPDARGLGVGGRLVDECLRFARRAGYTRITLWTNDVLRSARRIYQRAGFELVDSAPHYSFGHDLVGQTWERAL